MKDSVPSSSEHPLQDRGKGSQASRPSPTRPTRLKCDQRPSPLASNMAEPASVAAPMRTSGTRSFLDLPADVHYLVISQYLPWQSGLALRQTCKYFSTLLSLTRVQTLRHDLTLRFLQDERELLDIWARPKWWAPSDAHNDNLLGLHCFSCMRQLHPVDFVQAQTTRGFGLGREWAALRWCKACGLKWGWAQHGHWYRESWKGHASVRWLWYAECNSCCAECFEEHAMMWWGCAACFEKEERRRQKEDRDAAPMGVDVFLAAMQKWQSFRAASERKRRQRQHQGKISSSYKCHPLTLADRRVAATEENQSKSRAKHGASAAVDLAHQPRDTRWQTRCLACWEPNCQPRPFRTSLAAAPALSQDKWCDGCIADEARFIEKRTSQEIAQPRQTPRQLLV